MSRVLPFPDPAESFPGLQQPEDVSNFVLSQAYAGLLIPNDETLHAIYRELRRRREDEKV
jgi:hypothetical protein